MRIEDGFQEIWYSVLIIDVNGRIVASNKTAKEILGFNGEIISQNAEEILSNSKLFKVLESGEAVFDDKVRVGESVLLFHHKPVLKEGQMIGVVTSFQDITSYEKQIQQLEALKEQNIELEEILNSSFDEIYVTDGKGNTLRINKAGERLFGMKAEDIIGKNVLELEERGVIFPSITPQVIKEKRRVTGVQTAKNGQRLIATANPVFDESGNIVRIVTNSRDITELTNLRQRLEETEKLVDNYRKELFILHNKRIQRTEIVNSSQAMQRILNLTEKVAGVDSTVFIHGESGVGKGLIASRIHHLSKRTKEPFLPINCRAYSEDLIETELFGYESGAFAGVRESGKPGLVELADGGTLFFEEINEFPLNLQVKLFDLIKSQRFKRVGGNEYINVDVRIIASTHQNIQQLIKEGQFREDLYYSLNVVPIMVPPLRHRKEDIPALIDQFLQELSEKYQLHKVVTPEAKEALTAYNWPGNVRELENVVERLAVTVDAYEIIPSHLPDYILHADGSSEKVFVVDICSMKDATEEVERQLLNRTLAMFGNTYQMAEALKVDQSTIVRKMHRYGIVKDKENSNSYKDI